MEIKECSEEEITKKKVNLPKAVCCFGWLEKGNEIGFGFGFGGAITPTPRQGWRENNVSIWFDLVSKNGVNDIMEIWKETLPLPFFMPTMAFSVPPKLPENMDIDPTSKEFIIVT